MRARTAHHALTMAPLSPALQRGSGGGGASLVWLSCSCRSAGHLNGAARVVRLQEGAGYAACHSSRCHACSQQATPG